MQKEKLLWTRLAIIGLFHFIYSPLHSQYCEFPFRLVILGSSTSFGNGASSPEKSYLRQFEKYLWDSVNPRCEILNLSFPGFTTYKVQADGFTPPLKRASSRPDTSKNISKVLRSHPDAVIINLPTNDAESQFNIEETSANLLRITNSLREVNISFWVSTAQPRNFDGNTSETKIRKKRLLIDLNEFVLKNYKMNYLDFFTPLADSNGDIKPELNSGDGIHLNDSGHLILFNQLIESRLATRICLNKSSTTSNISKKFYLYNGPYINQQIIDVKSQCNNFYYLEIKNVFGKLVLSNEEWLNENGELSTFDLERGIYQMKIVVNNNDIYWFTIVK